MFSYIFMKILEKRPERYDAGIHILSAGYITKIRKRIVNDYVKPGMEMLDLGCGTGSLLIDAAEAGAKATGVDISEGMLAVARRRITGRGLQDKITLHRAGVVEADGLFTENRFDLIVSTLVFSELYTEERALALRQIERLLKPEGIFIIAAEVQPVKVLKRIIHFGVRLPLAVVTYLIAQTGTKPLNRITHEITRSGLNIINEKRSFLDSFVILIAQKTTHAISNDAGLPELVSVKKDRSFIKALWDFVGRWFPNPVEPGLRAIGHPNRTSPVLLTSNFHLTVRRVEKSLLNENAFLLVAPSNGINVWCAACGGELNTHSVITAVKTSRINERVDHRQIILPQFSAPGINRHLLKKESGRIAIFGPAYAKDIPAFLENRKTVFKHNQAKFPLLFRLEMLLSMNGMAWMVMGLLTLTLKPGLFFWLSAYFWTAGFILYAGYPALPGGSGWFKAAVLSVVEIVAVALFSVFILQRSVFVFWEMMLMGSAINFWLGFDLRGIVAGSPSEAEWLMHKIGMASFGHIFSAGVYSPDKIKQDIARCNNCRICFLICPQGVFGIEDGNNNIRIKKKWACFACKACVTQCPEDALLLKRKMENIA